MLVDESIFDWLRFSTIGLFVAMVVSAAVLIPKNVERKSERGKKIRRRVLAVVGVFVVFVAFAFTIEPLGTRVVIVPRDKPRSVLFGSLQFSFRDGHTETLHAARGTIVVNDDSKPMHVEVVSYGDAFMARLDSMSATKEPVAPNTITIVSHAVDFIDPQEPPKETTGTFAETKYWLRFSPPVAF